MRRHEILVEALAEIDEASTWYERRHAGLGVALLTEYRKCLELALAFPESGSVVAQTLNGATIRRFSLNRFDRYGILVASIRGVPTVLAFAHASRRPGYWRDRVE